MTEQIGSSERELVNIRNGEAVAASAVIREMAATVARLGREARNLRHEVATLRARVARGLKKRARKSTRSVPIPPVLVRLVREHIKEFGAAEDGWLFRAAQGGHLLSKEYGEAWKAARLTALTESEAASPLADVPYSLRHAGVSLWLESGVSPAEVARRAGHSIAVLFRFYAKAIHRSQKRSNDQIQRALEAAEHDT
ncbi:hypothetical protein [Streptomyces sp. NBC_00564]|uniref:hypothetical protein n=1 Tax=Streptomyces sp. NBC_00564 TaxID=2903663 RepID=UPI00352C9548|nr:tyrosine-type recombinase/integrase [Streptomyces sp. NBC_00564]